MSFTIPTGQLIQTLPHMDGWFKPLEKQAHSDLLSLPGYGTPPPIAAMKQYAQANPKFARSCMFVTLESGACHIEMPKARVNDRGNCSIDSRCHTYARMLSDLGDWCTEHGLCLPETEFAIYCCDTYAWEPEARNFPWFVMAKPKNKQGILIPDDSFVTHGLTGNQPLNSIPELGHKAWAWNQALSACKKLKGKQGGTVPKFYFKGSNTGQSKWDVRGYMHTLASQNPSFEVDLSPGREEWPSWSKYGALLDLPGNQPWSYRRKYLHLMGRPVIQVDVDRFCSDSDQEGSSRWIQFFDCLLTPAKHYAPFPVTYVDGQAPQAPNVSAIEATALHAKCAKKFATTFSGRRPMSKLTSSHVLQYLYMTIWHYHLYFGGSP